MTSTRFTDDDPVMKGLRDGSISWAEAFELEAAEEAKEATAAPAPLCELPPQPIRFPPARPPQQPGTLQRMGVGGYHTYNAPHPAEGVAIKTIIARNLPRDVPNLKDTLRKIFDKYGAIKDIYIPENADRSSPYFSTIKGFALIKFLVHESALNAFHHEVVNLVIGRRPITLEFAKEDR